MHLLCSLSKATSLSALVLDHHFSAANFFFSTTAPAIPISETINRHAAATTPASPVFGLSESPLWLSSLELLSLFELSVAELSVLELSFAEDPLSVFELSSLLTEESEPVPLDSPDDEESLELVSLEMVPEQLFIPLYKQI